MENTMSFPNVCKMQSVISFYTAKEVVQLIYRRLYTFYGVTVMSDGLVRDWCRQFINGRTVVHNEGPRAQINNDRRRGSPSWPFCSRKQAFYDFRFFNKIFQHFFAVLYSDSYLKTWVTTSFVPVGSKIRTQMSTKPNLSIQKKYFSNTLWDGRWRMFTANCDWRYIYIWTQKLKNS